MNEKNNSDAYRRGYLKGQILGVLLMSPDFSMTARQIAEELGPDGFSFRQITATLGIMNKAEQVYRIPIPHAGNVWKLRRETHE